MFESRQLAALCAIAVGGVLNAGLGAQFGAAPMSSPASAPAQATQARATQAATTSPLQRAAHAALLAQLRSDLGDPGATIELSPLAFERADGRSLEGRGSALARFDGSAPVRLDVSIVWDLQGEHVEQASWLLAGPATQTALDVAMKRRIADRIGSRLVLEFAGQPVDFSLRHVQHLAAGRERLLVSGDGVADFGDEGAAHTRFVATADRASGKLLTLQYELGEQLAQ